jgi:hypothetical protein
MKKQQRATETRVEVKEKSAPKKDKLRLKTGVRGGPNVQWPGG